MNKMLRSKAPEQTLATVNAAQLLAMSQQGNENLSHAALLEQATAQAAMQQVAGEQNLEVPKVNFYPSQDPNPVKARKKDIKQAYKLLTPLKRSIFNPWRWIGRKYKHNKQAHLCVIDGCDVKELIQHDNLYSRISDEDTGKTLWDMYWQNPVTGEAEAFIAREGVTSGRKMRATYCPEHLHLYHLLCKWEAEQDKANQDSPRTLRDRVKKGVSIVTVPVSTIMTKDPQPTMLQKYEPFFAELEKDSKKMKGISIQYYENPITKENDITTVSFDLRIFRAEMEAMKQPTPAFQALMAQQIEQIVNENPQLVNTPPVGE